MNSIFILVLSLSVSGTILALFLLAVKPIIKNKFSYTWQYYIWLLVILRFLLPFTPQFSIVGGAAHYVKEFMKSPLLINTEPYSGSENKDNIQLSPMEVEVISSQPQTFDEDIPLSDISLNWKDILNYIWLLWISAALLLLLYKIASYRRFVRFIKMGREDITEPDILTAYKESLVKAKVQRSIPVFLNKQISSPMLLGLIQPQIIIPSLSANSKELQLIFHHELTHYKKLDFIYKWLIQITLCMHWFNPIVYFIAKEIDQSCELSCDESVIRRLSDGERVVYGDALMASVQMQGQRGSYGISINLSNNANHIKERLDAIMNYKKKSKFINGTMIFLTIMFFCGFTYTGAYVADNYQSLLIAPETKTPYFASYSKDNEAQIGGRSIQGNWAASDTVTGSTYWEQLDNKAAYLEQLYHSKQELFIVEEGIAAEEIQHIDSIKYLYDTSEIYRALVAIEETLYIQPQSAFSKLSDEGVLYNRYVFNLETPAKLTLPVSYELNIGKMALWIVSPTGEILYQMEPVDNFHESIELELSAGLHSAILIQDLEEGRIRGDIFIEGAFTPLSDAAAAAETIMSSLDSQKTEDKEENKRSNSLIENFERYSPFGISYNLEQDAVYYYDERVKLFVEFKPYKEETMNYAFELCYQDGNTDSKLYLEAIRDIRGNITEIRPLDNETAVELLGKMSGVSANKGNNDTSKNNSKEYHYVTMDATQINERYSVTAKDILLDEAPENIIEWVNECNKSQGAFALKTQTAEGYITYVYYNGGGRYPWNINVDDNTIIINLFKDSNLATKDSYHLMYFTAPKDYADISLQLEGEKLTVMD